MRTGYRGIAAHILITNNRVLAVSSLIEDVVYFLCAVRLFFLPQRLARRPTPLLGLVRRATGLVDLLLHVPLLLVLLRLLSVSRLKGSS